MYVLWCCVHTKYVYVHCMFNFSVLLRSDFLPFSDVRSVAVSVMDASTQSSQVGVAPCHNLLEEVRRDNQQL